MYFNQLHIVNQSIPQQDAQIQVPQKDVHITLCIPHNISHESTELIIYSAHSNSKCHAYLIAFNIIKHLSKSFTFTSNSTLLGWNVSKC